MPTTYELLIDSNTSQTKIRHYLVNGNQISVTLCIPDTLRDTTKEETNLRGMSFSVSARTVHDRRACKKGV